MAEQYLRRSVLFDLQDEALVARLADQQIKIKTVNDDVGRPVPVLFGTRYIDPAIVAWQTQDLFVRSFFRRISYRITNDYTPEGYGTQRPDGTWSSYSDPFPITSVSLRMVLCLGGADAVNHYTVEGNFFRVDPVTLPSNYDASVVSLWAIYPQTSEEAPLFGGAYPREGSLGMPSYYPQRNNPQLSRSHFWLSNGQLPQGNLQTVTNAQVDGSQIYTGMTSLWFYKFNFGGKIPLVKWKPMVSRILTLTEQDDDGQYNRQWRRDEAIITAGYSFGGQSFGPTMNPAHALRECLTNKSWGAGIPEDELDEQSFEICSTTCQNDGLDFCYLWDTLEPIDKLIKSILDYIDAVLYYDSHDGLYRVKVIRDDYVINAIPQFAEHNIQSLTKYKRLHSDEAVNSVTIVYHDYLRGINDALTLTDQVAVALAGKKIGASFAYEGCATKEAALRVAERELTAISQSLISFSIHVDNTNQTLGIGDAINVSWRDIGIQQLVCRILRIRYGDGTTAGVTLDVIQDVFADIHRFGEIVKPQDIDVVRPTFPNPNFVLRFYEQSYFDLLNPATAFVNNPLERWIKFGRTDTFPDITVSVDGYEAISAVTTLPTMIPDLDTDPRRQSISFVVKYGGAAFNSDLRRIRINDEIMMARMTRLSGDFHQVDITERAVDDSIATIHYLNSELVFLDRLTEDRTPWDGGAYTVYLLQDNYNDRESIVPVYPFVGRGNLAPVPRYVKIRDQFVGHNIWVDGDLTIKWQARARNGDTVDTGQQTRVKVTTIENTVISTQVFAVASKDASGNYPEQTVTISKAVIEAAVGHTLGTIEVEVDSLWQGRRSWQAWNTRVDWASYDRSGQRQGWNFDWSNNWGGGNATGFGYDWDNQYSN